MDEEAKTERQIRSGIESEEERSDVRGADFGEGGSSIWVCMGYD